MANKVKKRPDGRIQGSFRFEGKRYFVFGKNDLDLAEKKTEKLKQLRAGQISRANPKLSDYYKEFTDRRYDKVSGNTIRIQCCHFGRCKDIPVNKNGRTFGDMRISDIKPRDLLAVQDALKKKYTARTVNDTLAHIKYVFETAIKEELIDKNPCVVLDRIKETEVSITETRHRALTEDETARFFTAAKDRNSFYYNALAVMIRTGLRIGEMAALTEFNVDFKNKMLYIRKTATRDEVGGYVIGTTTKTKKGIRDIPASGVLDFIRDQMQLKHDFFGNEAIPYLFPSADGEMLREQTMNREITRICEAAGIERFTCHALRATFATRFIEQRPQDFKILSEILGHASVDITLNLYTHVMQESKIQAMQGIVIAI